MGKSSGRKVKRSLIFEADEGLSDQQVAEPAPPRSAGCGSASWKAGWRPSMTCRGRGNGANLMAGSPLGGRGLQRGPGGTPAVAIACRHEAGVDRQFPGDHQACAEKNLAVAEEGVVHPQGERRVRSLHGPLRLVGREPVGVRANGRRPTRTMRWWLAAAYAEAEKVRGAGQRLPCPEFHYTPKRWLHGRQVPCTISLRCPSDGL